MLFNYLLAEWVVVTKDVLYIIPYLVCGVCETSDTTEKVKVFHFILP